MSALVDPKKLAREIQDGLHELAIFTATPEFRALLQELWGLPLDQRAQFVANVILDPHELAETRGIRVPTGLKLQRSAFRDNRPTLFCVVRYIPSGSKVTITFDNSSGPPALSYQDIARLFEQGVATQTQL